MARVFIFISILVLAMWGCSDNPDAKSPHDAKAEVGASASASAGTGAEASAHANAPPAPKPSSTAKNPPPANKTGGDDAYDKGEKKILVRLFAWTCRGEEVVEPGDTVEVPAESLVTINPPLKNLPDVKVEEGPLTPRMMRGGVALDLDMSRLSAEDRKSLEGGKAIDVKASLGYPGTTLEYPFKVKLAHCDKAVASSD